MTNTASEFEAIALYNKCEYPNLAAECHTHNYDYSIFALHAGMETECFLSILTGEERFENQQEVHGVCRVLNGRIQYHNPSPAYCSIEYLTSRKLSVYDMSHKKHYRKALLSYFRYTRAKSLPVEYRQFEDILYKNVPFPKIVEYGFVTRAYINQMERYSCAVFENYKRKQNETQKRRRKETAGCGIAREDISQ